MGVGGADEGDVQGARGGDVVDEAAAATDERGILDPTRVAADEFARGWQGGHAGSPRRIRAAWRVAATMLS